MGTYDCDASGFLMGCYGKCLRIEAHLAIRAKNLYMEAGLNTRQINLQYVLLCSS